jgi:CRISPR-associated protein Cas1
MDRIVDIATEGLHLSTYRGFLLVEKEREEVGRIALDDIHAVIGRARAGQVGLAVQKSQANRNAGRMKA